MDLVPAKLLPPAWSGRVLMVGFGAVGQGVLPLLLHDLGLPPGRLRVVKARAEGREALDAAGVACDVLPLTAGNLDAVLAPRVAAGDVLLNLAVDVSSTALIVWCQAHGVLYLDTCIEPWAGGFLTPGLGPAQRSNHALREAALVLRRRGTPTALVAHGANPGLVSHFLKQALLDLAGAAQPVPARQADWAALAQRLQLRVVHIAERDTQTGARPKAVGEFVNTWSCEAFVDEALQPAELGWGTHERQLPADAARHARPGAAAIYLNRPGGATRVRSWTPGGGPQHGFLVTHAESISIADHFTVGDPVRPDYRPTVHYAYHPCDAAVLSLHELAGRNWRLQPRQRLLRDDIIAGRDELGVLLMGPAHGAYWYGSRLSIEEARRLAPANNATTLQVAAGVVAGLAWLLRHPREGVVEPDGIDFAEVLAAARPWLGPMEGVRTDWTPLADRGWLFDEAVDRSDPWQFVNFRVA